jgi:hypothetical protein
VLDGDAGPIGSAIARPNMPGDVHVARWSAHVVESAAAGPFVSAGSDHCSAVHETGTPIGPKRLIAVILARIRVPSCDSTVTLR